MRIKNDCNLGWSTHIGGGRQRTRTRKEEKRKLEVAKMIKRRKAKKRGKEECEKASKEITTRQESQESRDDSSECLQRVKKYPIIFINITF